MSYRHRSRSRDRYSTRDDRYHDRRDDRRDDRREERTDDRRDDRRDDHRIRRDGHSRFDVSSDLTDDRAPGRRRRVRQCGWDDLEAEPVLETPSNVILAQHQQLLNLQQTQAGNKKAREIYMGNLAVGHSSISTLKDHFNQIFSQIPEFQSKYSSMLQFGAVRDVKVSQCGMFGFVEFWTEELASTALEMDKHDFFGRSMRIGRPSGYVEASIVAAPLDVNPLREIGILPPRSGPIPASHDKKLRELYVGNLPAGAINADLIKELFEPACKVLPEFNPALGSPVVSVDMQGEGRFAFVEFQNESLCNKALLLFHGMEVLGRRITVGRPQGYVPSLSTNTKQPKQLADQPARPVQDLTDLVASLAPSQSAIASLSAAASSRLTSDQITAALTGRRL